MCGYVWYSEELQSSYFLAKKSDTKAEDSTQILQGLLGKNYISGASLFNGAPVCELVNLFPEDAIASYGTFNDQSGFFFGITVNTPATLPLDPTLLVQVNATTWFFSIS